ncbi:IgGFc-binding protein isoform X2 [Paramisgurnus dabryanus]
MLAVLLTIFMFSQGFSMDNCGTNFITAFPENIAYYRNNLNYLKITILLPNTDVSFIYGSDGVNNTRSFSTAGITWTLNLTKDVEEYRLTSSNKSIIIRSNNNITVLSMTGWPGRLQSHVIQPEQNLRTVYTIPTMNYTEIIGAFGLSVCLEVRYSSFRLLIINAVNTTNTVSIKKVVTGGQIQISTQTLNPYFLYQLQINGEVTEVSGTDKIAVILSHPCFEYRNCSCYMVMNQLRPAMPNGAVERFPLTVSFTEVKQLFLTTSQSVQVAVGDLQDGGGTQVPNSKDILPLLNVVNNAPQLITTSMPVSLRLITPGIILDLIPVSMFSGCFLVHFYSSKTGAFIIAETSSTASVQMNHAPLPSATTWDVISGTQYSMTTIEIGTTQPISATIWHPNSKIAVYTVELWMSAMYASPAIIINDEADHKGCALTLGKFVVGNEDLNWTMSREYCNSNSGNFAKILLKENQDMMDRNIIVPKPTDGWIGLRRSLFTTEWYWSNSDNITTPLNFTYWADKQPDLPERGLCAAVSMDPGKTFMWKSAPCCSIKKPICFKNPTYIILNQTAVY